MEIKLNGPRAKWKLNNKCVKLRGALRDVENQYPLIMPVLTALYELLGVNGGSIEWGYLNTGTHDAQLDNEFDRAIVLRIVDATIAIDAGLSQLQQR